jgi:acetyl esterase/lipase
MDPARRCLLVAASAGLAACSPLGTLNTLAGRAAREGIAYGDHERQRLDLYVPDTPRPAAGWPAVLFFYGGSWNRGHRADYRFVGAALASRGVLVAVADYRLYPEVRYPAFLHDGALATAWLLREAPTLGADATRVFVMGHSAGAYNAAMLALDPRWLGSAGVAPRPLAGWIGLAGPYDFFPITNPDAQPVFSHPDYPIDSQPLALATAGAPPTFLGAAIDDTLVNPQRNTQQLASKLQSLGVPVRLKFYERVDHASLIAALAPPLRWLAPVLDDVSDFVLSPQFA